MGFCFSYCRRRPTDDHEPLLSRQSPIHEALPPPKSHIDKAADVLAALHVGKLPSQDQTNAALRKVLHSSVLAPEDSKSSRVLGRNQQYGLLSERGKTILEDIRELVEAVVQFGMEKNDDDRIQDLIYQNRQIGKNPVSVDLDAAKDTEAADEINNLAKAIPSFKELDNDTRRLSDALFTLSRILLTSNSFRFLLSEVLLASRGLLADAAYDFRWVAYDVECKAAAVEETMRPEDEQSECPGDRIDEAAEQMQDGLKDISEAMKEKWDSLGAETTDRLKESVVDRLQKVLDQAQKEPAYKSALHTLIYLLSKYVERVSAAVSAVTSMSASTTTVPTPVIATDPNLRRALTDLRILLERLAWGRSLSPLILNLERTLKDFTTASSPDFQSDLRHFFGDLRLGIEKALGESGFATSSDGRHLAEQLFERGRALLRSNALWSAEVNKVLDELDSFVHALALDRTTRRIIDALDRISNDTSDLFQDVARVAVKRQRVWCEELKTDLLGWVLPRALSMLETLPMPRVELKSKTLEVVVDALVLTARGSFLPDHIFVQNWNEVRMNVSAASGKSYASGGQVQTATRTHVHLDGLRLCAHRIGYYVKYSGLLGGLISWEDNGIMNVDIGREGVPGEGLSVDIELDTSSTDQELDQNSVFHVNDVKVDFQGLHISIGKSRHWILNQLFLQPLASPVIRRVLRRVLASQIRAVLENINERLSAVRSEANQRVKSQSTTDRSPSIEDYWKALCATIGSSLVDEESENHSLVETDTQVTLQGVVRNTRTQMNPESSSPPTPSETLVAVGIGAQILPGKGGPESVVARDSATEKARRALTEVEDAAENAAGKAKAVADDAIGAAAITRESLEDASARVEAREGLEVKKRGWRSQVFDF